MIRGQRHRFLSGTSLVQGEQNSAHILCGLCSSSLHVDRCQVTAQHLRWKGQFLLIPLPTDQKGMLSRKWPRVTEAVKFELDGLPAHTTPVLRLGWSLDPSCSHLLLCALGAG